MKVGHRVDHYIPDKTTHWYFPNLLSFFLYPRSRRFGTPPLRFDARISLATAHVKLMSTLCAFDFPIIKCILRYLVIFVKLLEAVNIVECSSENLFYRWELGSTPRRAVKAFILCDR